MMGRFMYLTVALMILLHKGEAIWLSLPATGTKCVSEELHNNVVVLADYVVISDDHVHPTPSISAKVTSPYGNTLHHKENVTHSQFAFTTPEAGNYLACFWADNPAAGSLSVNIDWKTGIAAKDWESVARKEKIEVIFLWCCGIGLVDIKELSNLRLAVELLRLCKEKQLISGVELELKKLEGAVEAIHENLIYLKSRESEMRAVSETTNTRVAWFSIMSLGVCIMASLLQIVYLKHYFHKKKLI